MVGRYTQAALDLAAGRGALGTSGLVLHHAPYGTFWPSPATSAGDVNGDGYGDVLVGAYGYDHPETNEGGAFLYYGSASGLQSSPAWTAESNQAEACLGWFFSSAGDVNGDSYTDVLIGAYHYSDAEPNEGAAFAWYGSASGLGAPGTPANADWHVESDQSGAEFTYSVRYAGDVNGDGYADIVIGAPFYDNGQADEGRAYVYLGSAI